eukprot:Plantae.Rhodophyta-Palmaria_palmata.ctg13967.p1 GENE.Plantae.Rhodophyta-Palmaria_palmata.ctg13967~~Plantae.Rhodophyta-Palmaria_palmata.ctg13967.p1  ORF type:complete len:313 (+),score=39.31 Plantae.Rhodophyta-Palmaria_palmata.ctg13967:245-1183(+)
MPEKNTETVAFQNNSFREKVTTGFQLVTFPLRHKVFTTYSTLKSKLTGSSENDDAHGDIMEAFYETQAKQYDAFREEFLHARAPLLACLPVLTRNADLVWIDIGGGTGRNLEFFPPSVIRQCFKTIYVIDISQSLLNVAKARVEKRGLQDIIHFILGDINDEEFVNKTFPKKQIADFVTFSYSLSMIPNRNSALNVATNALLKQDGYLGVADFWHDTPSPSFFRKIEAHLHSLWFKQDNVHLLRHSDFEPFLNVTTRFGGEHDDNNNNKQNTNNKIDNKKPLNLQWLERHRGAVPLLPILRPYNGILLARKK